jgi:hypothetical protein
MPETRFFSRLAQRLGRMLEVSRGSHYSAGFGYADAPQQPLEALRRFVKHKTLNTSSIKTWNGQCQIQ